MRSEIHVWMPMIGFDRDAPDKGVAAWLSSVGFTPRGVSVFLFHPDIVHLHDGLAEDRALPPDNCSYYGSPRNEDRCRQDWTTHDLRALVQALVAAGVAPYLGIMGVDLGNRWHHEWLGDHPEVRQASRLGDWSLNVLKRLRDGTFYEDFFVEKLCQVMTDYGFAGLQVADNFCPGAGVLNHGDFSADMLRQFLDHSGRTLPADLSAGLGSDSLPERNRRGDWLWSQAREDWIGFYAWRWEGFWSKVCGRLHAIGRKAIVMGMYCTDPFETLYCKGIDLRRLARAGVDYILANIVPTGLRLQHPDRPDRFHRDMLLAPLTAAWAPEGRLLSLLGVKDATEEWDVLHHAPSLLERDIATLLHFQRQTGQGLRPCLDGLMVCLGDGIHADEWSWLRRRLDIAEPDRLRRVLAPTVLWSDEALDNTLPAYIHTRRWTLHRIVTEIYRRGTPLGAVVRSDDLAAAEGTLFVPTFDLLSAAERAAVAAWRRGPVVTLGAARGASPEDHGMRPDVAFVDPFSDEPMRLCAWNTDPAERAALQALAALAAVDDGTPNLAGPPEAVPEHRNVLVETLTFCKATAGFCEACAQLLRRLSGSPFTCNLPMVAFLLDDGRYRLHLANPDPTSYGYAVVCAARVVAEVAIRSTYPVLPVAYMDSPDEAVGFGGKASTGTQRCFRAKITPGGVTILEVRLAGSGLA